MKFYPKTYKESIPISDYMLFIESLKKISGGNFKYGKDKPILFYTQIKKNKFILTQPNENSQRLNPVIIVKFSATQSEIELSIEANPRDVILIISLSLIMGTLIGINSGFKPFILVTLLSFFFFYIVTLIFYLVGHKSVKQSIRFLRNLDGVKKLSQ